MRMAPLGDVARYVNGVAFRETDWGEHGLPIVRIQNLTDPSKPLNRTTRSVSDLVRARPGDLLVSWSATLGVFSWPGPEDAVVNQHIFRVLPNEDAVDRQYLRHMLGGALRDMERHLHGATMKHVNRSEFLGTTIPLPPLEEQRRIAAILDQAGRLQGLRRAVLAGLRELRRSLFRSMFDADSRSRWSSVALSDALAQGLRNGVSPSSDGTVEGHVLTLSAVTRGRFDGTAVKDASFSVPVPADQCVQAGLVLICRGNGNRSLVGRAVISALDMPGVAYPDTVIAGRLSTEVEPQYFLEEWDAPEVRRQIETVARTTNGTFKVNQVTIGAVRLRLPPLALQREFGQRVEAVMRHEETAVHQLDWLRDLFASLQDRAFKGEL